MLTATDVKKMAALEAEKQGLGCDDTSCLAELAGAMGARLVVFGDANKLGTLTVLTLNLFDSSKAQSVGRVSAQAQTQEELPSKLPVAVRDLVRDALQAEGIALAGDNGAPAMTVKDAPSAGSPVMAGVWTWGLVGVGALAGIGGLAFDLASPTSDDADFDGADLVGPGIMAAGAGAIALGLLVNPFAGSGGADAAQ